MFFINLFTTFRTSETLGHLMRTKKSVSFPCCRLFNSDEHRLNKKEYERPHRMFTQCMPSKPVFMEPQGKVAIITGTTGIGIAVAYELLHAGAHAVVCAGTGCTDETGAVQALKNKFGQNRARYFTADISYERDFIHLFDHVIAYYRKVDILFNNGGVWNDCEWEECIDTNLGGAIRGTQLAVSYMGKGAGRRGRGGLVVNCASTLAFDTSPSCPAFCASQHGIVGLTQCMGHPHHYKSNNLRVVTLCPGLAQMEMSFKNPKHQHGLGLCVAPRKSKEKKEAQTTYSVARAFLYLVKYGKSGHHYVVDGAVMSEMTLPPRQEFSSVLCRYKRKRFLGII